MIKALETPSAVESPIFLDPNKLLRKTMQKSGPGLIAARSETKVIAKRLEKVSINFPCLIFLLPTEDSYKRSVGLTVKHSL